MRNQCFFMKNQVVIFVSVVLILVSMIAFNVKEKTGYSVQDAAEALKRVDKNLKPEERIKQALKS